ncbi:unannotated protein [freshwater metagenome]|uniref:Unannotated protein n=1 Tax=freshwater metagenome TaxID=449393 RepID=A0A6J6RP15_9ZZZZ
MISIPIKYTTVPPEIIAVTYPKLFNAIANLFSSTPFLSICVTVTNFKSFRIGLTICAVTVSGFKVCTVGV